MDIDQNRLVEEFINLVKISSPSLKEREVMDYIIKVCKDLGLEFYEDSIAEKIGGDSGNLILHKKGNKDVPAVLLMAHVDTVSPGIDVNPIINGDIITSDGTTILGSDDKAGVAIILEVIRALSENDISYGDIEVVFTVGEEIRLLGSRHMDYSRIKAKYGFILDSGGEVGTYTTKAPYHNDFQIFITGKAAHAGIEPEKGVSAVKIAADAISEMPFGKIDHETTLNVGYINGGGATNVVTEKVLLKGEVRSRDEKKLKTVTDSIMDIFNEKAKMHKGECKFDINPAYSGYIVFPDSKIVSFLEKGAKACGVTMNPKESGGGSDTNNVNEAGIEAVDMGIGMTDVHSVNESIKISTMVKAVEYLVEIIKVIE